MNARDFPALPVYAAVWQALRFEPMRGTGEAFTCAIAMVDEDGAEVRRVLRDDILQALFGQHADHVEGMIDMVCASLQAAASEGRLQSWQAPVSGFSLAPPRHAASQAGRQGAFRQAVQLSAAFSQLDFPAQEVDERPALEAARKFIHRVRDNVVAQRADLARYFEQSARLVTDGSLVRFGFLMPTRAAHFEILRPATLSTSVRIARGKLYELRKARSCVPLERAALVLGAPTPGDLGYSDNQHAAIRRELHELELEAQEDDTAVLPAYSDADAAAHVLELAA